MTGIPFISMTDAVQEWLAAAGLDTQKWVKNYLIHGKWVWKELMWTTLFVCKNKWVPVERVSADLSRIPIPHDMVRFINISVIDGGKGLRMLLMDDSIATSLPSKSTALLCNTCGCNDDLKACVNDYTLTLRDIVIGGTTYKEKSWKRVLDNGDVYEHKITPVQKFNADGINYTVDYITTETLLASLQAKPCGCLVDSQENRAVLVESCGCAGVLPSTQLQIYQECGSVTHWGRVKVDRQTGYIWIKGLVPPQVMLCTQSNGEQCEEEVMIPEYVIPAFLDGMYERSVRYNTSISRFEKTAAAEVYEAAKIKVLEFLNPLRAQDFMDTQMALPKWGYGAFKDDWCLVEQPAPKPLQICPPAPPSAPSAPPSGPVVETSGNLQILRWDISVKQGAEIEPDQTVFIIPFTGIIENSVEVVLDGGELSRASEKKIAAGVVYSGDKAVITFNQGAQFEQDYIIRATRYNRA